MRVLVTERDRFLRFLSIHLGNAIQADDVLKGSLLRALEAASNVRRGERVIPWFYRILRQAIADHYQTDQKVRGQPARLWTEPRGGKNIRLTPPAEWDTALCVCFEGLLPTLNPRYADILRRIELRGEAKSSAGRDHGITMATLDVVLHRARIQLRERLEAFCGASSHESCLDFATRARERRAKKV